VLQALIVQAMSPGCPNDRADRVSTDGLLAPFPIRERCATPRREGGYEDVPTMEYVDAHLRWSRGTPSLDGFADGRENSRGDGDSVVSQ
jgi:hypothetical protein